MLEFLILVVLFFGSRVFPMLMPNYSQLFIICEQEDAQIYIDGVNTGFQAPSHIYLPKNKSFRLSLHREGFIPSVGEYVCRDSKCFIYLNLQREALRQVL